ncbi:hypothetical protein O93_01063 [Bartonella quintana JK 19]|nr:hypothetical protein O93_01063 [Bartonella quintana JK 19]
MDYDGESVRIDGLRVRALQVIEKVGMRGNYWQEASQNFLSGQLCYGGFLGSRTLRFISL